MSGCESSPNEALNRRVGDAAMVLVEARETGEVDKDQDAGGEGWWSKQSAAIGATVQIVRCRGRIGDGSRRAFAESVVVSGPSRPSASKPST